MSSGGGGPGASATDALLAGAGAPGAGALWALTPAGRALSGFDACFGGGPLRQGGVAPESSETLYRFAEDSSAHFPTTAGTGRGCGEGGGAGSFGAAAWGGRGGLDFDVAAATLTLSGPAWLSALSLSEPVASAAA